MLCASHQHRSRPGVPDLGQAIRVAHTERLRLVASSACLLLPTLASGRRGKQVRILVEALIACTTHDAIVGKLDGVECMVECSLFQASQSDVVAVIRQAPPPCFRLAGPQR